MENGEKAQSFWSNCWIKRVIMYFVIISFLFPRGYIEYSDVYKEIYTVLIWTSTFIIWIQFLILCFREKRYKQINKETIGVIGYFIFLIVITFLMRGINIKGYQKLVAYPSIILFTVINFKKNPKEFLNCINNIILIIFGLQQLLLRNYFHITFLGHVQMVAQIGVLGIFCTLLYYKIYHEQREKTLITIIVIMFSLITTDASSSLITAIMLAGFAIMYLAKKCKMLTLNSKIYIIIGGIISVIIIAISVINGLIFHSSIKCLEFSGRDVVWIKALPKLANSPIYGYGVEGVIIDVFWATDKGIEGFNYSHNQNIQNLLDGGIVALILFYLMMMQSLKNVKNISNSGYRVLINSCLICYMFIMVFESTTIYCYMYIYLAMASVLPFMTEKLDKKSENVRIV